MKTNQTDPRMCREVYSVFLSFFFFFLGGEGWGGGDGWGGGWGEGAGT